jgi:hypothetical protein
VKKLTKKERAFCRGFLDSGSIAEAEKYAGMSKGGDELISRDDILEEIERLSLLQDKSLQHLAKAGLKRLAMGSIADAISLINMDKSPDSEKLKEMDLFMVSEIKRNDKGGIEIKFFDRFKALDKLSESCETAENTTPFYDALVMGAKSLGSESNGN